MGGENVVASGAASRCEVQVAYAIGIARPMSILVETFGTETVSPDSIASAISEILTSVLLPLLMS